MAPAADKSSTLRNELATTMINAGARLDVSLRIADDILTRFLVYPRVEFDEIALHHQYRWGPCDCCQPGVEMVCDHCLDLSGDHKVAAWPCPTAQQANRHVPPVMAAD